jgi:hypothetical protein
MEILGINFTPSTNQSAVNSWTTVTNSIKAQARDVYCRELRLNKGIQYFHTYLLARAWFTAQVLPIPKDCKRQIGTAVNWFLCKGGIFKVPVSTLQRNKREGGWGLIDIGAKCRALLYHRIQTQQQTKESLTAGWLQKWGIKTPNRNHHKLRGYRKIWTT